MGALLSLPLLAIPSMGTIAGFAATCCGAAACNVICKACGTCQSSIATRIAYAFIFLVNSMFAWIMLTPWAIKKLEHLTLDYMQLTCPEGKCHGVLAVHRINFALGLFHLLLAVSLIGVISTKNKRSTLQNGWWGPKLLLWVSFVILSFFIPNSFFLFWGNYVAMIGSIIFILIGLILLVDFAHSWAEKCHDMYEETGSKLWASLLLGSSFGMYAAAFAMTVVMYIYFAHSGCSLNISTITINLLLAIIATIISISPAVQDVNPRSGLAQSGMVVFYATYLTMSAVANEPDDKNCNPLSRHSGTRTATIVLGAMFTFLAIAYSTTRAATQGSSLGGASSNQYSSVPTDPEHGLTRTEPRGRSTRYEALRAAVEAGAISESAMQDELSDDEDEDRDDKDDEKSGVRYAYTTFHIIFFLATCYTACLLTGWNTLKVDDGEGDEQFVFIGRSYAVVWTKVVSVWIVYGMYIWSLVAPVVFPDRFY